MADPNTIEFRIVTTGAEQAAKVLQGVADAGARVGSAVTRGAAQAEQSLTGLWGTARRVFEVFTGVSAANAVESLIRLGREAYTAGLQAVKAEAAFSGMTRSLGVNGDALLAKMREVSRGLADETDTMLAHTRALQAGMSESQLADVMALATERARVAGVTVAEAYNKISEALTTNNTRLLRQFNLVIDTDDVMREYAARLGTVPAALSDAGRAHALYEATMRKANEQAKVARTAQDDALEAIERNSQRASNFWTSFGAGLVNAFGSFLVAIDSLDESIERFLGSIDQRVSRFLAAHPWIARMLGGSTAQADAIARLRDAGLTSDRPTLTTTTPPAGAVDPTKHLREVVLPMELALIKQREAAWLASLDLIEAETKASAHAGLATEIEVLTKELDLIDQRTAVRLRAIEQERALHTAAVDPTGKERQKLEAEAEAIRHKALVDRARALGQVAALERQYAKEAADAWVAAAVRQVEAEQIALAARRDVELTLVEISGTAEEAEIARIQATAQARVAALNEQLGETQEFADAAVAVMDAAGAKIRAIQFRPTTAGAKEDLVRLRAQVAEMTDAQDIAAEHANRANAIYKQWADQLEQVGDSAARVGLTLDEQFNARVQETEARLRVTEAALAKARQELGADSRAVEFLTADVVKLRGALDALKVEGFVRDLEAIRRHAVLLGPDFDVLGATLDRVKQRMLDVDKATGGMGAELVTLREEYDRLNSTVKARSFLEETFNAAGSALNTLVQGVILGTQSMADAFKKLGQSIVIEFANRVIQQALNPLMKAAANAVVTLFGGQASAATAGVGLVGAIGGGSSIGGGVGGGAIGGGFGLGGEDLSLWRTGISAFSSGASVFQSASSVWSSVVAGWDAGFGGLAGAGSGLIKGLDAFGKGVGVFGSTVTAVTAAVSIALTAMRDDITDAGKAIISSFYAAAAATAIGTSWTGVGVIVAGILAAIGAILDWTGIFEKASERWLSFPTRLGETLDKEGVALKGFGVALSKATDLTGVAQSIEDFRHSIEEQAGIGDFFERTAGLGPFQVPGIPGATGTAHEGGLRFDFGPFTDEFQAGINQILDSVRETIRGRLADVARDAMPADVADAFVSGMLGPLRQSLDELIANPDASVADVKAFEERMEAVADLIVGFGQAAAALGDIDTLAARILPEDILAAVTGTAAGLRAELIDLAKSGTATQEELDAVRVKLEGLAGNVLAFAQQATALGDLRAIAVDVLPADVLASVTETADTLRAELVDLATAGVATAEDVEALRVKIEALGVAVALYQQLTVLMTSLAGTTDDVTRMMILAVDIQRHAAERAVEAARDLLDRATTREETIAALDAMTQAVIARYDLERQMLAQIEDTIRGLIDQFGPSLAQSVNAAIRSDLLGGSTARLHIFVSLLEDLGRTAGSASVRLWAATTAIEALMAALPTAIERAGTSITDPREFTHALFTAAAPSFEALGGLIDRAITSGDLQGALSMLREGSRLVQQIAAAAIAGVEQWRDAAIAAAEAAADEEIDRINARADADIELLEAHKRVIERSLALSREWQRAAESLQATLDDLRPGALAPPNAREQFAAAMGSFQRLLAEAATNPEAAAQLGAAGQRLLETALNTGLMTLPSPEYRELFEMVTGELERVRGVAQSQVTPAEVAAAELESIDEQIEDVRRLAKEQADAIRDATAATVQAIHDRANAEIAEITAGLGSVMWEIGTLQASLMGQLVDQQEAVRRAVTGGLDTQVYLAIRANDQYAELKAIREVLQLTLTGSTSPPATPGPPPVPAATGGVFTRPTVALIGEAGPEAVIPLGRSGLGSVVVNVDARGATDPDATAAAVRRAVRDALREGPAREMVRDLARRV